MITTTLNDIETIIVFKQGGFNKYHKDNGFSHKILVRYSRKLYDLMKSYLGNYNIALLGSSKNSKDDVEHTKEYDFLKIMYYDNTSGFYEKCGYITLYTKSKNDNDKLCDFLKEEITNNVYNDTTIRKDKITNSITSFDKEVDEDYKNKVFTGDNGVDIKYKINILSLGRYNDELGTTHKILCEMQIHHYMFVEKDEYELYNNWVNHDYCELINSGHNYSNLKEGGQHIRNYIIEYWLERGEEYIWMLDDNIQGYLRLYKGFKVDVKSKEIFTSIEHYMNHFDNIGLCSHNIQSLIRQKSNKNCLVINGKHFSSLLINITTGIRFRFKYNEDHIFSIDNINQGYQTICFNHILYDKLTSGTQKGGNQSIYNSDTNNQGYIDKCNLTKQMLENEIENGLIKMIKTDNVFQITDKKISKNNYVPHLKIKYNCFDSNKNLKKIKEITEFNSGLVLV